MTSTLITFLFALVPLVTAQFGWDLFGGAANQINPFGGNAFGGGGGFNAFGGGGGRGFNGFGFQAAPMIDPAIARQSQLTTAEEQMGEILSESAPNDPARQRLERMLKQNQGKLTGEASPLNYLVQEYYMTTPVPTTPAPPAPRPPARIAQISPFGGQGQQQAVQPWGSGRQSGPQNMAGSLNVGGTATSGGRPARRRAGRRNRPGAQGQSAPVPTTTAMPDWQQWLFGSQTQAPPKPAPRRRNGRRQRQQFGPPQRQGRPGPQRQQGPPPQRRNGPPPRQRQAGPNRQQSNFQQQQQAPAYPQQQGQAASTFQSGPPPPSFQSGQPPQNVQSGPPPANVQSGPPPPSFRSGPPPPSFRSGPPPPANQWSGPPPPDQSQSQATQPATKTQSSSSRASIAVERLRNIQRRIDDLLASQAGSMTPGASKQLSALKEIRNILSGKKLSRAARNTGTKPTATTRLQVQPAYDVQHAQQPAVAPTISQFSNQPYNPPVNSNPGPSPVAPQAQQTGPGPAAAPVAGPAVNGPAPNKATAFAAPAGAAGVNPATATAAPTGSTAAPKLGDVKTVGADKFVFSDVDNSDFFQWVKVTAGPPPEGGAAAAQPAQEQQQQQQQQQPQAEAAGNNQPAA